MPLGDGVHTVEYYALEAAGNQAATASMALSVDATPPVSSAAISGTQGSNGWYVSSAALTLTATDATSGVASLTYRVDGGPWQTYSGAIPLADGSHTIDYQATDLAGNAATQSVVVKVDTTAPTISSLGPSGALTSGSVGVSWTGSDASSGIAEYLISVDGGAFRSVGTATSTSLSLADGAHTIVVRAVDAAGNTVERRTSVQIDTNAFSLTGPFRGIPTLALIIAAVALIALFLWWYRKKRRKEDRPS